MSFAKGIVCARCDKRFGLSQLLNLCPCGSPLLVRYDLQKAKRALAISSLKDRVASLWRYREILPLQSDAHLVSMGEGYTPLLDAKRLGGELGLRRVWIKDEAQNPTGSFKDRGLSLAISRAKELGVTKAAISSAGNAGGSFAAYAARAGIEAHVFMPRDTPIANQIKARQYGAKLELVDGLISDCGRIIAEKKVTEGWFDVSTLKEPYRVEGKKTMGYELAEQFNWRLPEVIVYPTGGGTGLIGMWKAFEELETMGLTGSDRPRMIAAQAAGCAPIVRAFEQHGGTSEFFSDAATIASGLRVPKPLGDFLILDHLYASHGEAVSASDDEMLAACRSMAELEGIFAAPEGGAGLVAGRKLAGQKKIQRDETVVLFNTGSGYKYVEAWQAALGMRS